MFSFRVFVLALYLVVVLMSQKVNKHLINVYYYYYYYLFKLYCAVVTSVTYVVGLGHHSLYAHIGKQYNLLKKLSRQNYTTLCCKYY